VADLGREEGDGVLGAEGHEAASSPRDVVHHTVAAGAYEDSLRLHAASLSAGSSDLPGSRRHPGRNPAPSNGTESEARLELE
jgi:hypothetical protein